MSSADGSLIGRAAEQRILLDALRAAKQGRSATVIVSGEAGIGKTALVQDLLTQAGAEDWLVAAAGCSPVTAVELPFGPIADLVTELLRQVDGASMVPEQMWRAMAPLTGQVRGGPAADEDGTRLFLGLGELMAAASRVHPTVLLVEDVHWADPASVDLLLHLSRRFRRDRILLIVTHRPVGSAADGRLRTALGEWFRQPTTIDLRLAALGDDDIAEIINQQTSGADPARLEQLCGLAQGVPFFAVHLAAHEPDQGLPNRLHDVLALSLDGLTGRQRSLLLLLAVSGGADVDDELLMVASGLPAGEFAEQSRELRDRGPLVVRGSTVGFRHALLRDVVLADALPVELRQAHQLLADALGRNDFEHLPGLAGRLTHHLLGCGRESAALPYAIRAAREAAESRAFADAAKHYRTALAVWNSVGAPDDLTGSTLVQLMCAAAVAERWSGRTSEGLTLLDELAPDIPAVGRDRALWEHTRGQMLWAQGDIAGALASQRRADTLLTAFPDDPLRPGVLAAVAHGLMVSGHAADAERTALAAATLAGASGGARAGLHARITAGAAQAQLGRVDEAVTGLHRCLVEARRLDDLELVVRSYGNLAFALGSAGRERELLQVTGDGIAECRRYGPVVSLASTLINNHVNALIAVGRWAEARSLAVEALQEEIADAVAVHLHLRLAELAVAQGLDDDVDRHLARAGEGTRADPYAQFALTMLMAELALRRDDPVNAQQLVAQAFPELQQLDDPGLLLGACVLGLRAAAEIADRHVPRRDEPPAAAALQLLAIAQRAHGESAVPTATALLRLCEAEFARLTGSDTSEIWMAAAAANRAVEHPAALAYCLLQCGIVLLRSRSRVAATRVLGESLAIAQRLGATPLVARVQSVIALGALETLAAEVVAPAVSRRASSTSTLRLTAREKQVLSLLATGATNRIIGRQLFISERTASVHVSNILTKMGAANRTEAARMALRARVDTETG